MGDFRCKTWLVATGHKTKAQATTTYASVVSRETVRVALMIPALQNLKVKSAYIFNAYVQTPLTEEALAVLGNEFSSGVSNIAIIV